MRRNSEWLLGGQLWRVVFATLLLFWKWVFIIKNKYFEDYEDFACEVLDTIDSLEDFEDVSIIAKYNHANQIIKELLCVGANIASIELHKEELEEYYDEYIISITKDDNGESKVWCEKFKREKGYLTDDSTVMYVMDDCSSKVVPYCKGKTVYEVSVGIEELEESDCESCDCKDNCHEYDRTTDDGAEFHISDKGDLNLDEEVEARMERINESLSEMDIFRKLFNW